MVRERNEAAREKEFVRQDMLASVARDQMILSNASSDERVMTMRRNRIMAAEQQERQIVESVHRETSRRRAVQQRAATEQAVATELQKLRDMSIRDEKMRQQLCDTEPEIRELRAKLDAGYVRREVQSQITENDQQRADTLRLKEETGRMLNSQRKQWGGMSWWVQKGQVCQDTSLLVGPGRAACRGGGPEGGCVRAIY